MRHETIKVIRRRLRSAHHLSKTLVKQLINDPRKGVQQALKSWKRSQIQRRVLVASFKSRELYERKLRHQGYSRIAGVDEVGRGPLAGPVVTCAIVLPRDFNLLQTNDSKQLTPRERKILYPKILSEAVDFSIGIGSRKLIDEVNIYQADLLAMKKAVQTLQHQPDYIIVDAMHIDVPIPQLKLYHGDAKSVSVGAASIVAKVYRDHLMDKYGRLYPQYGFKHNAGYGTRDHLQALKKYGITPLHRRTFNPVSKFLK